MNFLPDNYTDTEAAELYPDYEKNKHALKRRRTMLEKHELYKKNRLEKLNNMGDISEKTKTINLLIEICVRDFLKEIFTEENDLKNAMSATFLSRWFRHRKGFSLEINDLQLVKESVIRKEGRLSRSIKDSLIDEESGSYCSQEDSYFCQEEDNYAYCDEDI